MKSIGLLGGTGWSSTIEYYKLLNEIVNEKLGGYHSANILLKSIDYHDIMTRYGGDPREITALLKTQVTGLLELKPHCFMICCNTLHKYYDLLKDELRPTIPMFHPIELTKQHIKQKKYKNVLFLATKFTMEDGFFSNSLKNESAVIIPNQEERNQMKNIHEELMQNNVTDNAKKYFYQLIKKYHEVDAVILACSEWRLVVHAENSPLPVVDTLDLQCRAAVEYSIST